MSLTTPRPRALVLANRLPYPLDDGWKVRSFHMVRSVAQMADTTLLIFHPGEDPALHDARVALGPNVTIETVSPPPAYTIAALLRGIFTRTPVHVWNQVSGALSARLASLEAEAPFDVCIAETILMYPYMREMAEGMLRVVDTHNIDSVTMDRYARTMPSAARRAYARVTAARFRAFEARTFASADLVWVCSPNERELVVRVSPTARAAVIPNGVDTEAMRPSGRPPVPGRLVFFGRLDYFPNVDALQYFAAEIFPRIRAARPDAELHVVGPAATPTIERLVRGSPGMQMRGRVDDVAAAIEEGEVVVVPLRAGGGTRLKIVEALAMGRAVVSTTVGAEGLELDAGREILLTDTAEQFADAVIKVLSDENLRVRLGREGREAVRRSYDWSGIAALARKSLNEAKAAVTKRTASAS